MANMIGAVMAMCRNYFEGAPIEGTIRIAEDGLMILPDGCEWQLDGAQWVAIRGSRMHDGVWRLIGSHIYDDNATPEEPQEVFDGVVWPLYPPRNFVQLCDRIAKFEAERPTAPLTSESFDGYSHTYAQGSSGVLTWQEAHKHELVPYRRMFTEVGV